MGSVSVATKACLLSFSDLRDALGREVDEHLDMTLADVETQYDRLRIWAGNLGALQSGKSSLDFRLLESTVMLNNVLKLLAKLEEILKRSAQIVAGTVIPFDKLSTPDYPSDDSDTDDDDYDASEDLPATELRLHMMTIVDILGDLYKLSFRIRNSSTRQKSLKPNLYKEIDKETGVDIFDAYEKADLDHITESVVQLRKDVILKDQGKSPSNQLIKAVSAVGKIADSEDYLIQRISTAMTLRRKHLRYWQRHTKKLAEIPKDEKEAAAILQAQKVTLATEADAKDTAGASHFGQLIAPSLAGKTILSQTEATRYDRKLDDMLETQSAISYVSTAFGAQGDTVNLPPPPALDAKRQEFLCPYCGIICHARQRAPIAWRKHVLQDLQPYVCTYPACDDGAQLYGSRTAWLEHERLVHRRIWQCFEHAEPQFKSQDGLRKHLETRHQEDITEKQIDNLLAVSESSMADTRTECPLCLLNGPFPKGLENHIAFHLETFATFSIKGIVSAGDEDKSASEGQSRSAQVSDPDRSAFSGSLHFGSPARSDAVESNLEAKSDDEKSVPDDRQRGEDFGRLTVARGKEPRPNSPAESVPPGEQKPFRWMKGQLIGKGTFGRVYLGMNMDTGELIAVKQIECANAGKDTDRAKVTEMIQNLDIEIDTLQSLDHVNIVQYLGCERKDTSISIFLEYVPGGSIGSCLRKYGKFPESLVAHITRQTLSGLAYLHREGVLCRDIKGDSLLLDLDGTVKISDFGISKKAKNEDAYTDDATYEMQGSVFWMAPEVIRAQGQGYSAKVDIWSLGCTVLEMFTGRRPWSKEEAVGAIYKLGSLGQAPPIPDEVSKSVGPAALSFMYDCFTIDPRDRPTAARLQDHPFVFNDPNFHFENTGLAKKIGSTTGEGNETSAFTRQQVSSSTLDPQAWEARELEDERDQEQASIRTQQAEQQAEFLRRQQRLAQQRAAQRDPSQQSDADLEDLVETDASRDILSDTEIPRSGSNSGRLSREQGQEDEEIERSTAEMEALRAESDRSKGDSEEALQHLKATMEEIERDREEARQAKATETPASVGEHFERMERELEERAKPRRRT